MTRKSPNVVVTKRYTDYKDLVTAIAKTCKKQRLRILALRASSHDNVILTLQNPMGEIYFSSRNPCDQYEFATRITAEFRSQAYNADDAGITVLDHNRIIEKYEADKRELSQNRKHKFVYPLVIGLAIGSLPFVIRWLSESSRDGSGKQTTARESGVPVTTLPATHPYPATTPAVSSLQLPMPDPIASSLSDKPLVVVYPTWIHLGGHLTVDALDIDIRFDFGGIMHQAYSKAVKDGDKIPTLHVHASNVLTTLPLTEVNLFGFITDTSLHFETNWFTTKADRSHRYVLWALCLHPDMKDVLVMVTRDNKKPTTLEPGVISPEVAAQLREILPPDASAALKAFLLPPAAASSSRPTPP